MNAISSGIDRWLQHAVLWLFQASMAVIAAIILLSFLTLILQWWVRTRGGK